MFYIEQKVRGAHKTLFDGGPKFKG